MTQDEIIEQVFKSNIIATDVIKRCMNIFAKQEAADAFTAGYHFGLEIGDGFCNITEPDRQTYLYNKYGE